jgi:hypothetical protein
VPLWWVESGTFPHLVVSDVIGTQNKRPWSPQGCSTLVGFCEAYSTMTHEKRSLSSSSFWWWGPLAFAPYVFSRRSLSRIDCWA